MNRILNLLSFVSLAAKKGIDLAKDTKVRITWHTGEPGASIPATRAKIESAFGALDREDQLVLARVREASARWLADVDRVTPAMNNPGVREKNSDKSDNLEIMRHFVDDSKRIRSPLAQIGNVLFGQSPGQTWSNRLD